MMEELTSARRRAPEESLLDQVVRGKSPPGGAPPSNDQRRPARTDNRGNPWKNARFDLVGALLNLATYALLMSDVPRAGVFTNLNMRMLSPGLYSWFGSFAYQVNTIYRDPDNLENITAVAYGKVKDSTRVWSYTYDTTSLAMRTIVAHFNDTDNHLINCMNYRIHCGVVETATPAETFMMLDRVIEFPVNLPEDKLSVMNMGVERQPQHVRYSKTTKNRHLIILYDLLVKWFFDPVQHRLVRVSSWTNANDSFDACSNTRDRPYLCDAGPLADYIYSADHSDPESGSVTFVWLSMNEMVHDTFQQYHNLTNNMTLEVAVVEAYSEPITYVGGLSHTVSTEFDMVLLTRVRDCSRPASKNPDGDPCITIRVQDYRFEGASLRTDVHEFDALIAILRVFGQAYFVFRVITLFFACYFGLPSNQRSFLLATFIFLSEVPSHVIAFGSFIPIFCYTLALCIDGPIVNAIINSGGLGLQGNFLKAPGAVYLLICLLMRKQWLMAFMTMVWVRLQVVVSQFNRQRGVWSVRGHIFGILSTMSMVVGYYNPKLRDTRVIGFNELNPEISVLNARLFPRDDVNRRLGGYYSDLFTIVASGVVYMVIVLVLRFIARSLYQLFLILSALLRTESSQAEQNRRTNSVLSRIVTRESFFFCQTDHLPSTCHNLWMVEGLTCGWSSDVLVSIVPGESVVEQTRREIVMNIVQMSEPLNYLRLRLGFNVQKVYTYMDDETQQVFTTTNKLSRDRMLAKENKDCRLQLVRKRYANELSFHELVHIR